MISRMRVVRAFKVGVTAKRRAPGPPPGRPGARGGPMTDLVPENLWVPDFLFIFAWPGILLWGMVHPSSM